MSFFRISVTLVIIGVIIYVFLSRTLLRMTFQPCYSHLKGSKMYSLAFDSFYNVFNPSITRTIKENFAQPVSNNINQSLQSSLPDEYVCCVRFSTRSQKNLLEYIYGSVINYDSRLIFVEFKNGKTKRILCPYVESEGGLEDPRMISYGNHYLVSATEYICNKSNFPVLFLFDNNYNLVKRIDYNRSDYFGTEKQTTQKNWCPFVIESEEKKENNQLLLHTDAFPNWKVYSVDLNGGMKKVVDFDTSSLFQSATKNNKFYIRCSTSWKPYDESSYICGLHLKTKGRMPCIRSMLVLVDKNSLLPIFRTDVFCTGDDHNRIQYLSGLESNESNILLAYGLDDCAMVVKKIPKSSLKFQKLD